MPIHEYTCRSCNTKFDHLHKRLNDPQPVACPECGSKKTDRALSLFSVGAKESSPAAEAPGMCCHCGQPGPCGME